MEKNTLPLDLHIPNVFEEYKEGYVKLYSRLFSKDKFEMVPNYHYQHTFGSEGPLSNNLASELNEMVTNPIKDSPRLQAYGTLFDRNYALLKYDQYTYLDFGENLEGELECMYDDKAGNMCMPDGRISASKKLSNIVDRLKRDNIDTIIDTVIKEATEKVGAEIKTST